MTSAAEAVMESTTTVCQNATAAAAAVESCSSLIDWSGYPPPPILWLTSIVDTICTCCSGYGNGLVPSCTNWRESLGIPEDSWLAAQVPPLLQHLPSFLSFEDYLKQQQPPLELSWTALSSSLRNQIFSSFPPISSSSSSSSSQPYASSSPQPFSWSSLGDSLYKYAFETPSTALGDLTTPTALLVLVGLVILLRLLKSVLLPLFSSYGRWMGRRTHGVEWEAANDERIAKFGEYVFRLLYHSAISVFGIYYFWDKEWWAQPHGTLTLFQGFPNHPVEPGMAWYYLLQAAYNADAMLSLLLISFTVRFQSPIRCHYASPPSSQKTTTTTETTKKEQRRPLLQWWKFQSPVQIGWSATVRGDFREMMIHHVVTNLLVVGSSLCRLTRSGSMVFLVHDISDVPVDLSKLANFLKWKWTTLTCFLGMVVVWMMTRLYILPFIIYRSILTESHYVVQDGLPVLLYLQYRHLFYILVALLIVLHLAWFVMFLQIFGTFLQKQECHDLSEHKQGEQQHGHHHQQQQQQFGNDNSRVFVPQHAVTTTASSSSSSSTSSVESATTTTGTGPPQSSQNDSKRLQQQQQQHAEITEEKKDN